MGEVLGLRAAVKTAASGRMNSRSRLRENKRGLKKPDCASALYHARREWVNSKSAFADEKYVRRSDMQTRCTAMGIAVRRDERDFYPQRSRNARLKIAL